MIWFLTTGKDDLVVVRADTLESAVVTAAKKMDRLKNWQAGCSVMEFGCFDGESHEPAVLFAQGPGQPPGCFMEFQGEGELQVAQNAIERHIIPSLTLDLAKIDLVKTECSPFSLLICIEDVGSYRQGSDDGFTRLIKAIARAYERLTNERNSVDSDTSDARFAERVTLLELDLDNNYVRVKIDPRPNP